jgi:hypothetical protein
VKFFFDNNLSPHLARAIGELCKADTQPAKVVHLRDLFAPDTEDHVWLGTLADEKDWVVISQDRFMKSDLEREAVRKSGLIVFALHNSWNDHRHWEKAQNLVKWWPALQDHATRYTGGAAIRVPWNFSGKGKVEQIQLSGK